MNVTLNTSKLTYNTHNRNNKHNPSFSGSVPRKSAFLKPFDAAMEKLTDVIADNYSAPIAYSNRITNWLAKREKLDKIVGHMQTAGSFIISGMYMSQTLRNKNLDEKRKKTLAVNQGLTLLFSTLGAYFLDSKLANFWNKHVSMKYAAKNINITTEQLEKDMKAHQEKIKKLYKEKHPEDAELLKFKKPNLLHYVDKGLKNETLTGKLKGLDALKSLIVFGTVYRFIGPVAVTPFANMIGNKLFYSDKKHTEEKNEQKPETQNAQETKPQEQYIAARMPKLEKFLNNKK